MINTLLLIQDVDAEKWSIVEQGILRNSSFSGSKKLALMENFVRS